MARLILFFILLAAPSWCRAESFFLVQAKPQKLYGPHQYKTGTKFTIGRAPYELQVDGRQFSLRSTSTGRRFGPFEFRQGGIVRLGSTILEVRVVKAQPAQPPRPLRPPVPQPAPGGPVLRPGGAPPPGLPAPGELLNAPRTLQLDPRFNPGVSRAERERALELRNLLLPWKSVNQPVLKTAFRYPLERDGFYYLMPVADAVTLLGLKVQARTALSCPGVPAESFRYFPADVRTGEGFNRMYLVTDRSGQLAAVQYTEDAPRARRPQLPVAKDARLYNLVLNRSREPRISRGWSVHRRLNATARGLQVDTEWVDPRGAVRERSRLFLPQPMIDLLVWNAGK